MVIFHSYVSLPEGNKHDKDHIMDRENMENHRYKIKR